ncbi:hypothetical protein [Variovorax sp. OV700]|uniref:DUF7281 domain-containing protein n=1 Tax=Variovorax sp. OV700 TaxID=1882826 RepID=UPI000887335D|nr:hypothetical protein [Variovorax sp. OV700]SDI19143.1 hypothetical protein SAMN05444748_10480 [Variovorax sp. OV700]
MTFTSQQISFLQRLVAVAPASNRIGPTALFFSEHYSIGTPVGSEVTYSAQHHAAAAKLLQAHQLPVAKLGERTSRAEAAAFGGMSEKHFSAAPRARSVSVRCIGNCTLDGRSLYTPDGTHLVATLEQARAIACDQIMVVENFETFRQISSYRWIRWGGTGTLVVYRGDPESPNEDAAALVRERAEPVRGFFDFDPAGLIMARSIPAHRFRGLVLPRREWLRAAADTPHGRQLYDRQLRAFGSALDEAPGSLIRLHWEFMKSLASAVAQEAMLNASD